MKKKIEKIVNKDIETLLYLGDLDFYPDGKGGQLGDRGYINGNKFKTIYNDKIYLALNKTSQFHEGQEVEIEVDYDWEKEISVQHSAQHILSAAIFDELSGNTVGFQMGDDYSTIDIDIPSISKEMIELISNKTNRVIESNLPVNINEINIEDIDKYHLRKPVNKKVLENNEDIRIVSIGDYDHSACGGYHVGNTGEIGVLSIIKTEKVKGNLTRIYFLAGKRAIDFYMKLTNITNDLKKLLTCDEANLLKRVESLIEDNKIQRNKYKKILNEKIYKEVNALEDEIIFVEDDEEYIKAFNSAITSEKYLFIGKNDDTFYLSSRGYNCKKIVDLLRKEYDIKGGAGPFKGQVKSSVLDIDTFKKFINGNLEAISG
ncbi:MAG: alanyl-tRNA synthetase [Kosmotogales bacterium]|nr:alanyl-tRNA synthetase [Kosmotogales bacterium]